MSLEETGRNENFPTLTTFLQFLSSMSPVLYMTGTETSKGIITLFIIIWVLYSESHRRYASAGTQEIWRLVHTSYVHTASLHIPDAHLVCAPKEFCGGHLLMNKK
jgi:hypothetical protein